jgi:hypothetical protein
MRHATSTFERFRSRPSLRLPARLSRCACVRRAAVVLRQSLRLGCSSGTCPSWPAAELHPRTRNASQKLLLAPVTGGKERHRAPAPASQPNQPASTAEAEGADRQRSAHRWQRVRESSVDAPAGPGLVGLPLLVACCWILCLLCLSAPPAAPAAQCATRALLRVHLRVASCLRVSSVHLPLSVCRPMAWVRPLSSARGTQSQADGREGRGGGNGLQRRGQLANTQRTGSCVHAADALPTSCALSPPLPLPVRPLPLSSPLLSAAACEHGGSRLTLLARAARVWQK